MKITYVVITCRRNAPLLEAQVATCFRGQQVHVETDEDNLDARIGLGATGTKLLRALRRVKEPDWLFFVDDDCWVNCTALERACSLLLPEVPFIATVGCPKTPLSVKDTGGCREVLGESAMQEAQAWWSTMSGTPRFSSFYCGGAGMLLSRGLFDEVQRTVAGIDEAVPGLSELCDRATRHEGPMAAVPQDKLMSVIVNATRLRARVQQRLLRGLSLHDSTGRPRWAPPLNDWESAGTGLTSGSWTREKRVCDINLTLPKTPSGTFDYSRAARLQTSNLTPRRGQNNQHIVPGHANLVSWHGFKRPEMYLEMQRTIEQTTVRGDDR